MPIRPAQTKVTAMSRRLCRCASLLLLLLACAASPARAADPPAFSDWTAVSGTGATGTFEGRPISLSGPITNGSVTDHSFPYFNDPAFSPPLEFSDTLSLVAHNTG